MIQPPTPSLASRAANDGEPAAFPKEADPESGLPAIARTLAGRVLMGRLIPTSFNLKGIITMATLTGWAINIGSTGADHTYVTSSDGYIWPCWGRSAGGQSICAANGSSASANCFSQTDSHAGIIYAITGVCHQTANRVLYPAGAVVSNAGGYWASVLLYGTYGTHNLASLIEWEVRKSRCSGISGDMTPNTRVSRFFETMESPITPDDPALRNYLDKVNNLYAAQANVTTLASLGEEAQPDFLGQELELMADYRLGNAAPDMKALRDAQAEALKNKAVLDQQLISKQLPPAEYARQVNGLVNGLLEQSVSLLGEKTHIQLLGVAPGKPVELVDSDILAQHH